MDQKNVRLYVALFHMGVIYIVSIYIYIYISLMSVLYNIILNMALEHMF
jgi:hypothetical protein